MKKIIIVIGGVVVLGVAYYLISPLFRDVMVNEEIPENVISEDGNVQSGAENLSSEELEDMSKQMEEMNSTTPPPVDEGMPETADSESKTFPVMGTSGHPASGTVRVLHTTSGAVIRYENFSTINGPNLNVYLSADLRANDYIDLGPIKGTQGNINYEIPEGTDLDKYRYVMYWCVPFRVLFNYADIGFTAE